jgi:hypothetical protein
MLAALLIRPLSVRFRRPRAGPPDEAAAALSAKPQRRAARPFRPWLAYKRLTTLGFPRRFPIVQFPNLPLIAAFIAGEAGRLVRGPNHGFTVSVAYLAMTIWAYEELVHGVNWFRRLLGLTYVIILVVRVAHAVQA